MAANEIVIPLYPNVTHLDFTGPHQVRYALSRGHKLTLFNRGRRPREWPEKVEEITGDRETGNYASLKGRKFDVCIDNPTSVPHWVRDAKAGIVGLTLETGRAHVVRAGLKGLVMNWEEGKDPFLKSLGGVAIAVVGGVGAAVFGGGN